MMFTDKGNSHSIQLKEIICKRLTWSGHQGFCYIINMFTQSLLAVLYNVLLYSLSDILVLNRNLLSKITKAKFLKKTPFYKWI